MGNNLGEMLDLSGISYNNGTFTRVGVQMDPYGPFKPWVFFGAGSLMPFSDGIYILSGKVGQGEVPATDREHDPARVFSIALIQPTIKMVMSGTVTIHAHIAHDVESFRVPPRDYNPFVGATYCEDCASEKHAVVEEYLPPKNEELFKVLVGRQVEVCFIP